MGVEKKPVEKGLGYVRAIKGEIVEIEMYDEAPFRGEILRAEDYLDVFLEVYRVSFDKTFRCFCVVLSGYDKIYRGMEVLRSGETFEIPLGEKMLGRVLDAVGGPRDGMGPYSSLEKRTIYKTVPYDEVAAGKEVIETGIKAIDFFTPLLRGEEIGLFGGAGGGKTILSIEIMHNIVFNQKQLMIYAGLGERIREGHELYETLKEVGVLPSAVLVYGQMNETASARVNVGYIAATIAEYFRDKREEDIFIFIDNIYRFLQAGNELSMMMGEVPSEGGYQATLQSEIGRLEERLISTRRAGITSVQAIYVPADDITDAGVQAILPYFDSSVVLSRDVYQEGRYPAIDILASSSSVIDSSIVGEKHHKLYIESKKILEQHKNLKQIVSIVGEAELSVENRTIYHRAEKILNFMTQDFTVVATQTGKKGKYVAKEDTIAGVEGILTGEFDDIPPERFLYIGSIKDIKRDER